MRNNSQKKTILFIEFSAYSGAATGLLTQLRYLSQYHGETIQPVVISQPGSIFKKLSKKLNFHYYELEPTDLSTFSSQPVNTFNTFLYVLWKVLIVALKHKTTIIHCYHYWWCMYATPIGFLLRIPVLIHLKDVTMLRVRLSRYLLKFYPNTKYIAVSKFIKNKFISEYKISANKITLIYDGIDEEIFTTSKKATDDANLKSKQKKIIMMSTITREKNVELFIDMAVLLFKKYPNITFYHYGYKQDFADNLYYEELKSRAKNLQLSKRFLFKSYVDSPKKVAAILRESYLSVVPAAQFALPNTAIESILCGCPVIAYKTGGNPEVLSDGEFGFLVSYNHPSLYTEAVIRFLTDEHKYRMSVNRGIDYAHRMFSAKEMNHKLLKLYSKTQQ